MWQSSALSWLSGNFAVLSRSLAYFGPRLSLLTSSAFSLCMLKKVPRVTFHSLPVVAVAFITLSSSILLRIISSLTDYKYLTSAEHLHISRLRLRFTCVRERPCWLLRVRTLMRLKDLLVGGKKEKQSWFILMSLLPSVLFLARVRSCPGHVPDWKWLMVSVFVSLSCHLLSVSFYSSFHLVSLIPTLLHCLLSSLSLYPCNVPICWHREMRVNPAGHHFRQTLLSLSLCLSSTLSLPHSNRQTTRALSVGNWQPAASNFKRSHTLELSSLFILHHSYFHPPLVSVCIYATFRGCSSLFL